MDFHGVINGKSATVIYIIFIAQTIKIEDKVFIAETIKNNMV